MIAKTPRYILSRSSANIKNSITRKTITEIFNLGVVFILMTFVHPALSAQHPISMVEGVTGGTAKLHCKVSLPKHGEYPTLIFWYKGNARLPFFTLDLRDGLPKDFIETKMEKRVNSDETGEWLTIRPLKVSDSAQYKCKVDYDNSPSLAAFVNLTVYDPPSQLLLQDEEKQPITGPVFGPIIQDLKIKLYCTAIGGSPRPTVTWWKNNEKLKLPSRNFRIGAFLASQEEGVISVSNAGGVGYPLGMNEGDNLSTPRVVAELAIATVGRSFAGANLTCKAENNKLTRPLTKTIALSVYLRPLSVIIVSPNEEFKEGVEIRLKCEAKGSDPPAKISWTKKVESNIQTIESKSSVSDELTISWVNFVPTAKDHGSKLTCIATNPKIPGRPQEKSTILRVKFVPRVNLTLGRSLDRESIKEGDDVYFACEISSNPRARAITWHINGKRIDQDLKAGVLVAEENLVLQRIHRSYAGNYTCTASNDLGKRSSEPFLLPIKFLPVCNTNQTIVSVKEGESVTLTCKVQARPSDALQFYWFFNNTLDTVDVDSDKVTVKGTTSHLEYTPLTPRDYGMLSCWASNEVGMQAEPCRFSVIEAGPPERVKDCVLVNHTGGTLEVKCSPGNDGGSKQRFVAKVYASPTHTLKDILRNNTPQFNVVGLTPGQDYLISITAVNDKGSSDAEEIDAIRLKVAEKRMGDVKAPAVSPLVGVFLALVGGFILLLLLGIFLSRARSNRSSCFKRQNSASKPQTENTQDDGLSKDKLETFQKSPIQIPQTQVLSSIKDTFHQDDDEEGPDLVKSSNETSQLLDSRKCPDMITKRHPPPYQSSLGKVHCHSSANSPITQSPCAIPRNSFIDPQSPLHLPGDESFV